MPSESRSQHIRYGDCTAFGTGITCPPGSTGAAACGPALGTRALRLALPWRASLGTRWTAEIDWPSTAKGCHLTTFLVSTIVNGGNVRKKHPDKEIEDTVRYAEAQGWQVIKCSGHAWGLLRCPHHDQECRCGQFCQMSVWSTPKDSGRHARQLRGKVDGCIHQAGERDE